MENKLSILKLEVRHERDIVYTRQRVRRVAELLGFDRREQTRIATALSEVTRNAYLYAGGGTVEFYVRDTPLPFFIVEVSDRGPGMDLSQDRSASALTHVRRLVEYFDLSSPEGGGSRVTLGKPFPKPVASLSPKRLGEIVQLLARREEIDPIQEVQDQNRELLKVLAELRIKQTELEQLNRELEDTNRGVVALYSELDEKAESMRRASEAKTNFLSHITHEFRTPLNSILGLTRLALTEEDGVLGDEHRRQFKLIRNAAENLTEFVNDLLDLRKVESGKLEIRPRVFTVEDLFGALRGMLKPLLSINSQVSLHFDPAPHLVLLTDEGKLSQILRNFIVNALKYTESGEVRVSVIEATPGVILFEVRDTGIGIPIVDQKRIFEEYTQLENALQCRTKGTGLGLALCKKLAKLLRGEIAVESELGRGSTFSLRVPARWEEIGPESAKGLQKADIRC